MVADLVKEQAALVSDLPSEPLYCAHVKRLARAVAQQYCKQAMHTYMNTKPAAGAPRSSDGSVDDEGDTFWPYRGWTTAASECPRSAVFSTGNARNRSVCVSTWPTGSITAETFMSAPSKAL